ncbi:autoinducer 2 ABC transporter substrate-binding protein [bacterium]|nr:MAG: autoinducer 2 ABC transporter substrate-binding protein [bacterium]
MKLQHVGATLVLGGLFFLGGCAKSGDSTATTSTPSAGGSGTKQSVVYIPKNTGNSYFDSVITGFEKAGKEKGFEFTTVAPATADATSQIPFIKQQIQRGVNAIAISPNSPDALKPVLKEAMSKGIKVVSIDADLEKNEDARDAVVFPVDFGSIGSSQIELMSSLIGGKGEIAILSATTDAPNQNAWIRGMKESLKEAKYKDIKLVEVVYGDDEPQKSQRETEALLTKYPNLKGIIAPTSVGLVAAAQALETAQAAKRVQLTGLGLPKQMSRFVENGTVQKFALWDPGKMGYAAGYLVSGLLDNSIKPSVGGSFKAGDLGELKFTDKMTVAAGPPLVFDSKNIKEYNF